MKSYINFLSRNKLYTAIEAVGLSVSLAFVILIGTYIWQQYRVVSEVHDHDRIYIIGTTDFLGMGLYDKDAIDSKIPEIEVSARYSYYQYPEKIGLNGEFRTASDNADVDRELFAIFPEYCELVAGSLEDFNSVDDILLSESFADSFSEEDLVGQILVTDMGEQRVAGIYADRKNSMFPDSDIIRIRERSVINELRDMISETFTFFMIRDGISREEVESKIASHCESWYPEDELAGSEVRLYSLKELYFSDLENMETAHANKSFLTVLFYVVLALLISSVFNYINLSFAMTGKRAKEMATRRLVGASGRDVFAKCILESVSFTLVCFAVALMTAKAFEPAMNRFLVDTSATLFVPLSIDLTVGYLFVTLSLVVLIGVIAGAVPAWHAANYKSAEVINGLYRRKSKMVFSKIFIIVQNALSVVLISVAILMESQLSFMLNRPLNSDSENMFYFESESTRDSGVRDMLADEFTALPEVVNAGVANGYQGNMEDSFTFHSKFGRQVRLRSMVCNSSYFLMLNPVVVADFGAPLAGSLWFCESAAADLGLDRTNAHEFADEFKSMFPDMRYHVGGIIKDIPNSGALDSQNYGTVLLVNRDTDVLYGGIVLETVSEEPEVRESILAAYDGFVKKQGIYDVVEEAVFVSDTIYSSLEPARRQIRLVEIFMFIAVLLSFMGLLAMSTYFTEQKSKEIAVRKVFGGTVESETFSGILSYMFMVLTACVIGLPAAIYASVRYLEQFAIRIGGCWWIFVVAVLLSFVISLLSVLWQVLKAARTNPATELKKE